MFSSIRAKVPTAVLLPTLSALLLSACTAGGGKGTPSSATTAATAAHAAVPAASDRKDNIVYRQESYNGTELDSLRKVFLDHFKVEVDGKNEAVQDAILRIPWPSIEAAQATVATPGMPVRGIYITYGLDGDRFHPIFEFMYPDPLNGNLLVFENAPFSFDGTKLRPESDPKKYTDAYIKDIRINRTGPGFSALKTSGEEPDPLATWYQYADKVNNLLEDNPVQDTVLVISCISQQLCYRAIVALAESVPECRHLIALHIGDGTTDNLSTGTVISPDRFNMRAMDMGSMCPRSARRINHDHRLT